MTKLKLSYILNIMKKPYKNDKSITFYSPKQTKIPVLTHSVAQKAFFEFKVKDNSDKQVNVICPNCQFHFKIQLKLFDRDKRIQEIVTKPEANLQKLIEHQFSLISNYSRQGSQIQNSPILKLKNQQNLEMAFKDSIGLERLQKLNELSQLQKSRLQQSKATERFNPSPKDSPIEQYESFKENSSPVPLKESQIQQSSTNIEPQKQLRQEQKQVLRQKIFDYFEMAEALTAVLDWISANEHYNSLPSYIRLIISVCQEKLNANGFD